MRRPGIDVRIDELVLHGISPGDREAVAHAIQQQLASLLQDSNPRGGHADRSLDQVDAGSLTLPSGASPAAIGEAVGRAVHGALPT